MGRKKLYHTEEERLEAQRKWQMDHYRRNKKDILQKAKKRYQRKKRENARNEKRRQLYGDQ